MPAALGLLAMSMGQPRTAQGDVPAGSYVQEIDAWHAGRIQRLESEGGYLSLVGLHRLRDGVNTVGSDSTNNVRLVEKAPAKVGSITLSEEGAVLDVVPGVEALYDGESVISLEMISDASGDPTIVTMGTVSFYVIQRRELWLLRVKDTDSYARTHFNGIERYPVAEKWRVTARLEPDASDQSVPVPNQLGYVEELNSPGTLAFDIDGTMYRLRPVDGKYGGNPGTLWLIFGDATSSVTTYGGGRYLYTELPAEDGTVVIDFNKAYNPPCVFSPYATCPLPPKGNILDLAVEAGEKDYQTLH